MSHNVILDLSNATARSKGQAIRRQYLDLSSDARKDHRKAARQKRTGLKKQGSAERTICDSEEQSQEALLAPLARMEKPSDSIVKGDVENGDSHHDREVSSRIGCSAFTIFPRFQSTTNKRALGQATRYMNANARKQSEQDLGATRGMKSGESLSNGPDCNLKSLRTEPVVEDGTITESIPKGAVPLVFCEQPKEIYLPEFDGKDSEQFWTMNSKEPVRKGTPSHQEYCLKPLCEYFTKDLAFKARKDCHKQHHYSYTMICEFCGFKSIGALKDHIMSMHFGGQDGSTSACMMCNNSGLDSEKLFNHVEGCVLW